MFNVHRYSVAKLMSFILERKEKGKLSFVLYSLYIVLLRVTSHNQSESKYYQLGKDVLK